MEKQSTSDEDDREFIEMLGDFGIEPPAQFFQRETTKDSTKVRAINHAIYCIIDQLRNPISIEAENMCKWLVYKQAAAHRHQAFFGRFRNLNKFVRSYNDMGFIKRLNNIYKRSTNSGDDLYLIEPTALRYIGCAYLRRIYVLDKIRECCIKTANSTMGLLELQQWKQLSLVIVALCGEIHSDVLKQVEEMAKAYKFAAKILREIDTRFPEKLSDIKTVERIRKSISVAENKQTSTDISTITNLLRFTEERMGEAQDENMIDVMRNEVLSQLLEQPVPDEKTSEITKNEPDLSDIGISISRADVSIMNSTIDEQKSIDNDVLCSPFLFASSKMKTNAEKGKKKNNMLKRKIEVETNVEVHSTAEKIEGLAQTPSQPKKKKKSKKVKTSPGFLATTMNLISTPTPVKSSNKKKVLKKKRKNC